MLVPPENDASAARRFSLRLFAIANGAILVAGLLVVYLLLGGNPANLGGGAANPGVTYPGTNLSQDCQTGADANTKDECRVVGYVAGMTDRFAVRCAVSQLGWDVTQAGSIQSGMTSISLRPRRSMKRTVPSAVANNVSSLPMLTLSPG